MSELTGPFLAIYRDPWSKRVPAWWRHYSVLKAGLGAALHQNDRTAVRIIVEHAYAESLKADPNTTSSDCELFARRATS